jgi:hypothetical protein
MKEKCAFRLALSKLNLCWLLELMTIAA